MNEGKKISLSLGSGGKISFDFVKKEIISRFSNPILDSLGDGANILNNLVVTTDNFTVHPEFFDGGNIGILSFCGMVNDLASMASKPMYMTMGLVIEEGYDYKKLLKIIDDIKNLADNFDVKLICGDTKVVEKGKMEGIHISITGIGLRMTDYSLPVKNYKNGDKIILTGTLGEHTISVLKAKGAIEFDGVINSDVAPLCGVIENLIKEGVRPKFIRDVTRGGFSAVLNELSYIGNIEILIDEEKIPVNDSVKAICDIYGYDIYSLACEGRMVIVVEDEEAEKAVSVLKDFEVSKGSSVVGEILSNDRQLVVLKTMYGGKTILDMPLGEILPRIC
ncbi:MAG: hydrogenase expression/formation protein HypE [Proteobacteria bacterium]|nr:hydrogenase expression/formation protein HypE [Pseudomonadota bacterium]